MYSRFCVLCARFELVRTLGLLQHASFCVLRLNSTWSCKFGLLLHPHFRVLCSHFQLVHKAN